MGVCHALSQLCACLRAALNTQTACFRLQEAVCCWRQGDESTHWESSRACRHTHAPAGGLLVQSWLRTGLWDVERGCSARERAWRERESERDNRVWCAHQNRGVRHAGSAPTLATPTHTSHWDSTVLRVGVTGWESVSSDGRSWAKPLGDDQCAVPQLLLLVPACQGWVSSTGTTQAGPPWHRGCTWVPGASRERVGERCLAHCDEGLALGTLYVRATAVQW